VEIKMTFFVDTNFFLECKKYDQLNWSEITADKDITILITRPVQIEIDRLKNKGNTRSSNRARETTSLFNKMLETNSLILIKNTTKNNITFEFAKQYTDEKLSQSNPTLDMANNDDKILAILNMYLSEGHINADSCAFLSNDTNPILTAKLNNIPVKQIPESWLLNVENDERDKEILKMKQQVLEYQKKEPQIKINFNVNDYIVSTESPNEFDVKIKLYNRVEQSDIEELVNSFVKKHPQQINFDIDENGLDKYTNMFPFMQTSPPTDEEIEKYNTAYKNWEESLYELPYNYADKQNQYTHIFPFNITLKNNGNFYCMILLCL
jgi:hypothetical protein